MHVIAVTYCRPRVPLGMTCLYRFLETDIVDTAGSASSYRVAT